VFPLRRALRGSGLTHAGQRFYDGGPTTVIETTDEHTLAPER
jgi:hypothetical protein